MTDWVIPSMALDVDETALRQLISLPQVVSVQEDKVLRTVDDPSNTVIGVVDGALNRNFTQDGTGQTVAILDTGVQSDHPSLAGKVVSQACYEQGQALHI